MSQSIERKVLFQTTTGVTPTDVVIVTVPASSIVSVTAHVLARTSGGVRASWALYGSLGREGGGASLISIALDLISPRKDVGATTWAAVIDASGNDTLVKVTGQISTTITWIIVAEIVIYTP